MQRIDTETSKAATAAGIARRKEVEASNANTEDVGATNLAGFRAILARRYGNVVKGWMEACGCADYDRNWARGKQAMF